MMALLFGQSANAIGKGQCISEILETETPLQPLDPVPLEQRPFANLWLEIPNLSFGHSRRVGPTGNTFFASQLGHDQRSGTMQFY
jgi:hypothetical protein